jgi:hypothetical protein
MILRSRFEQSRINLRQMRILRPGHLRRFGLCFIRHRNTHILHSYVCNSGKPAHLEINRVNRIGSPQLGQKLALWLFVILTFVPAVTERHGCISSAAIKQKRSPAICGWG